MRPELTASLDGHELPVVGDGALMAALGQARSHTMRDIVASIQAEQDQVIRAPAASVTYVEGGPGTGKTAVALHRAAYLLYQDRRRYAGGILIVSPTPLLVAYTEGVLPSLGEEGQVAIRAVGSLVDGAEATLYDSPAVARAKGSYRMLKVLRKAARGRWRRPTRWAGPGARAAGAATRPRAPRGTATVTAAQPRGRAATGARNSLLSATTPAIATSATATSATVTSAIVTSGTTGRRPPPSPPPASASSPSGAASSWRPRTSTASGVRLCPAPRP